MISESRRLECEKLVNQYESMVQGELIPTSMGAYLEEVNWDRKPMRRYLEGKELEEIRQEIRSRKTLELKAMVLWDDKVDFYEDIGEFFGDTCICESLFPESVRIEASCNTPFSDELETFLKSPETGRILLVSNLGDVSLREIIRISFSVVPYSERRKAIEVYCSEYTSVLQLFFTLKKASVKGIKYIVIDGIGKWIGLSKYGEQLRLYIKELGLVVIGYGGSSYAISIASRETFGTSVQVLSYPYCHIRDFLENFPEGSRHGSDIFHHMKCRMVDDPNDWFSMVARDVRRGWDVSCSSEFEECPDGELLKAEVETVIWKACFDYISSCLWDEMDYGERFWYKIPNSSIRNEAVRTIVDFDKTCPYAHMAKSSISSIEKALCDMGILVKVFSDRMNYIPAIPWLMGIYISKFENVFERVLMEERCNRPKDAYRLALGFAYSFSFRYLQELELVEKSEVEFCEAAKIDWLYKEDFDEKCREEAAREKRVADRHGWLSLGLED